MSVFCPNWMGLMYQTRANFILLSIPALITILGRQQQQQQQQQVVGTGVALKKFLKSFLDYHLVADARVAVTYRQRAAPVPAPAAGADEAALAAHAQALQAAEAARPAAVTETLFPYRHQLLLPLNNLNVYFNDYTVTFNQHTALNCDR